MAAPEAIEILHARIESLLDRGDTPAVVRILRRLHPADSSELLYRLSAEVQNLILQELPWEEVADVLEELNQEEMAEVVQSFNGHRAGQRSGRDGTGHGGRPDRGVGR